VSTLVKHLALRSIAAGVQLPDASLGRFQELASLKRLLADLNINCVIDVGANRGQFASEVRGIDFKGQMYSFEPIASEFAQLQASFAGDTKWRGFQMALGSADGETELNVIPGLTVMSSILEPKSKWPGIHAETVQVRRLDALWSELLAGIEVPRVLLKMDTQGFDLNVFAGASGCLSSIACLQSELSIVPLYEQMPHYLDALRTYEAAGFRLYNMAVVSRTPQGSLQELNCTMVR